MHAERGAQKHDLIHDDLESAGLVDEQHRAPQRNHQGGHPIEFPPSNTPPFRGERSPSSPEEQSKSEQNNPESRFGHELDRSLIRDDNKTQRHRQDRSDSQAPKSAIADNRGKNRAFHAKQSGWSDEKKWKACWLTIMRKKGRPKYGAACTMPFGVGLNQGA